MEENARRRLQQQFEQHLELINFKLMRQREREERLRERYRQQQLAAMAAENDEDYDYVRKFKENSVDSNSGGSSNVATNNNNNNNNNLQYVEQYDNTNKDFSYKYPSLENIHNLRDRINFAVDPNDPRYYETTDDDAGGYMVGNMEANNEVEELRDEDAGGEDDEGVEVDKEEDLDSHVLDEYEEYTPQDETAAAEAGDGKNAIKVSGDSSTMVLPPQQGGIVGQNGNANFYRIKPQSASAAAAAGVNSVNVKQLQSGGVAPARQDMTSLIDKLHPKGEQMPQAAMDGSTDGHMVVREHLGMKGEMGMYVVALIAGVSAAATVGLFVLGIAWYT